METGWWERSEFSEDAEEGGANESDEPDHETRA